MLSITLPDGSVREVASGTTPADIAAAIGPGLAKAAIAARVDEGQGGELRDLSRPLTQDARLSLVTQKDEADALELARHDFAHVMAEAVQHLFPGTQITFGPATDDGFYYDFAPKDRPFTDEDLPAIEAEMRRIIAKNEPFTREVWSREQLIETWQKQGETFKAEWAAELPDGEELTIYRQGAWLDMCRGPHMPSTGRLDPNAFKLTRVSGAYWRGDQKNAMLSRVYGTGWLNKKQLDAHLTMLEEAAKRDHRKIGAEMDLFHLQSEAQGSVFWHPKGYILWRQMEAYMRRRLDAADYAEVKTPQLMDARQWEQSGHWGKYRENMFVVPDEIPNTEDEGAVISGDADMMALKPMNCPAHVLIFKQGIKSYRDLPIRMAEFGCCHRNEPHGALHGIMRVRQFTQDDAHIFVREDQLVEEVRKFCELLHSVYQDLGFTDYAVKLALRPEKRFGSDEMWDRSEQELREAVQASNLPQDIKDKFEELPGEGAFYAPKLEFHLTDAIGRTWQVGTIQSDRVLPDRLDASYVGEDGNRHRPVMLHRAILGTFERFIGILIEHHAGRFPLWLSPVQAVVATIVSDADDYAHEVAAKLRAAGIRVETDLRNEKINYKVREHSVAKVPNLLVVGKREAEEGKVALRRLGSQAQTFLTLEEAVQMLRDEARAPDLR
ncbi:threonine--tRNA ligase [Sphingomonas sp. LR60]|uniref:threonine--tRNA ligase n=1 Tax=Sphingomonas sp. LR60 TaxID=3050233 RepID=UPI002FE08CF1